MGQLEKTEAPAPRFRRRHRQYESASSSSTSETSSNSSHSSQRRTDTRKYADLLEEEPVTHAQTSEHTLTSTTVNGTCDETQSTQTANGLGENDTNAIDMPLIRPCAPGEVSRNSCCDVTSLQLPCELEDLPHSDILSLTSDPNLSISYCRVYREDALLLVLFVCNTTETPLRDMTVELSCEELEVSWDCDSNCIKIMCIFWQFEMFSCIESDHVFGNIVRPFNFSLKY